MPRVDQITYASFEIDGATVMASDGCAKGVKPTGFSLTATEPNDAKLDWIFAQLSEGGTVRIPLTKTFFSPKFGELTDHFGVRWMVLMPSIRTAE